MGGQLELQHEAQLFHDKYMAKIGRILHWLSYPGTHVVLTLLAVALLMGLYIQVLEIIYHYWFWE